MSFYHNSSCPGFYNITNSFDGGICRIKVHLGHIAIKQLHAISNIAQKYGNGKIQLTTRSNIQIRGIKFCDKKKVIENLILNKLGPISRYSDNMRNIMINPTSGFDKNGYIKCLKFSKKLAYILQISKYYQNLSPKSSIYIDGGEYCKAPYHISDILLSISKDRKSFTCGLTSCLADIRNAKIPFFSIPFFSGMIFIKTIFQILIENNKYDSSITRVKHLVIKIGYKQIIEELRKKIPDLRIMNSSKDFFVQDRCDIGIHKTKFFEKYYLGVRPILGRLKSKILFQMTNILNKYFPKKILRITPWQGIIIPNISYETAKYLKSIFRSMNFSVDIKDPYSYISSCSGLSECNSSLCDTKNDAIKLAKFLIQEKKIKPIHLFSCKKCCSPEKNFNSIKLVAVEKNLYNVFQKKYKNGLEYNVLFLEKRTINDIINFFSEKYFEIN